jgi:hypothetical protein
VKEIGKQFRVAYEIQIINPVQPHNTPFVWMLRDVFEKYRDLLAKKQMRSSQLAFHSSEINCQTNFPFLINFPFPTGFREDVPSERGKTVACCRS